MRRPFETVMVPLREGVARALIATDFRIVASTSSAGDPAQILVAQDQPILLIIDASREQDEVISQIKLFRKQYPQGRVAVLADRYQRDELISAYRAGANACFTKAMSCGAFLRTIELVMLGETILPPELLPFMHDRDDWHDHAPPVVHAAGAPPRHGIEDAPPPLGLGTEALRVLGTDTTPRLSAREKCILRCIAEGCSNKSIARRIDIAEATVKVHVKAILRKIRVSNRTQAAIWAVNNSSLVWSVGPEASAADNIGHSANGSRESCLFAPAADANRAKRGGVRVETQRPIRKQIS